MKKGTFFIKNILNASFITMAFVFLLAACQEEMPVLDNTRITEAEIVEFQKGYGISIVAIGNTYRNGGDFELAASNHIQKYYGFDDGKVLFKPTFAEDEPVRTTFEGALSFFIGENESYPTDEGFALTRWTQVKWKNAGIINDENIAIAMGRTTYIDEDDNELVKDYTMCFKKDANGKLHLIAHKASPVRES